MGNFYWEGTDKQGSLYEGALESHSREVAKEHLLLEGYYRVRFWKIQQSHLHRSLNNTEITEFLLQLHRLLKSGVELDDALGFCGTGAKRPCFELPALPDSAGFAGRTFNEQRFAELPGISADCRKND